MKIEIILIFRMMKYLLLLDNLKFRKVLTNFCRFITATNFLLTFKTFTRFSVGLLEQFQWTLNSEGKLMHVQINTNSDQGPTPDSPTGVCKFS